MNISGVLVHAHIAQAEKVREQLVGIEGVEVHAISPEGRIVVTVESETTGQMADTVLECQNVPGVLAASMIYHHDEVIDEEDFVEAVSDSEVVTKFETDARSDIDRGQDWNVQEMSK